MKSLCLKWTTSWFDSGIIGLKITHIPHLFLNDDNAVWNLQQWPLTNITLVFGGIAQSRIITVCMVVQNCCKGVVRVTSLVNGTPRFSDPRGSKTPELIDIKFGRGDYVGDITPHANFGISLPQGAVIHMRKIVIIRVYFFTPHYFFIPCTPVEVAPFDRFSCFMAQKTCFGDSYVPFGVRTK